MSSYSYAFDRVCFFAPKSQVVFFIFHFLAEKLSKFNLLKTIYKCKPFRKLQLLQNIFMSLYKTESCTHLQKNVKMEWLVENTGTSFKNRYQSVQNIQVTKKRSKINNLHSFVFNISLEIQIL